MIIYVIWLVKQNILTGFTSSLVGAAGLTVLRLTMSGLKQEWERNQSTFM